MALLLTNFVVQAQGIKPKSVNIAYVGETITHPGLKISLGYQLAVWEKIRSKKHGREDKIQKSIGLSPGAGFFYHRNYQTGLWVWPELDCVRKSSKGNLCGIGIGAGYMRTFVPNVFTQNTAGVIEATRSGNHYFITGCLLTLGKDLSVQNIPLAIAAKPQIIRATPNYAKGVWYFALEIAISYKLPHNSQNDLKK